MTAQNTKTVHKGGCLCGTVTFEITGDFNHFFLCHCERCRKGTGSAHASNLFAENADLKWLSGEEVTRSYAVPGTRHGRHFCTSCGSPLPRKSADGSLLVVPAGSLETPVKLRPNAHIFTASRANWDESLENIPAFPELPA
ncbi:GFA family protein [Roseibium litorale]|uniref:GFA family protein n=1 Tax=Roseibium litorale TaxID=2803841 RepID=A0ABR9CI80_9HYPH|nr:GFA family protein [Roseibium litorale]